MKFPRKKLKMIGKLITSRAFFDIIPLPSWQIIASYLTSNYPSLRNKNMLRFIADFVNNFSVALNNFQLYRYSEQVNKILPTSLIYTNFKCSVNKSVSLGGCFSSSYAFNLRKVIRCYFALDTRILCLKIINY